MATDTLTARNHRVTLSVEGTPIPGPWKTFAGGGLTGEATMNSPGGMEQEESIPNTPKREPVTITREYKTSRDAGLFGPGGFLETAKKQGLTFTVTKQDLDHRGQPVGPPKHYSGTANDVSEGDLDSESGEVRMCTVVVAAVA